MGRTVRFEQVYVANLEAEPVEDEQLTGIKSILTREIEAEEIILSRLGVSNTSPSKAISVGDKLYIDPDDVIVFDLKERGRASRFFVDNQISIGTTNPTKTFQINSGEDLKFNIDLLSKDLVTINGNVAVNSNIILTNDLKSSDTGSNLIMGGLNSNVISVKGNVATTNLFASSNITVGSNVFLSDRGSNVAVMKGNVTVNGGMYVYGNTRIVGNLYVAEGIKYESVLNLAIRNSTIVFGEGNNGSNEPTLLFTHDNTKSNVAIGFIAGDRGKELAVFQTTGSQLSTTFTIDDTVSTNLHVFGDIYTSNAVGVANIYPTHDLCVGSNLFVEDIGSNVLEVFGNTFTENLKVGSNVTIGNGVVVIDTTNKDIATVNGNVKVYGLRTTGTESSGISNVVPTDTLSIGTKVYVNLTAANTLTIFGNTMTTNLITQSISSSSNITIHSDRYGADNLDNPLILKSGPTSSNISSIEIYGASTSNTHQNIRFKTRNHEKMRITSNGQIGINISNPTQKLTVNGNAFVMGSNVMMFGNLWGTTSNTSMQVLSNPQTGENRIENIVDAGKGLSFYASQTPTMGTPKLTLLENGNVGVGVASPIGRFHTSGGSVYINNQVVNRGPYSHDGTPLIVSNTSPVLSTSDNGNVLHLSREGGTSSSDGVRATFALGKHTALAAGTSDTRLKLALASTNYETDKEVMTFLSSGKVGIGHVTPSAFLEVATDVAAGEGIASENGILVHNHNSGDGVFAAQSDLANGNAFTSYIQTNGAVQSGWSVGVSNTNGDFRITPNVNKVYDPSAPVFYIDGSTQNIGIGNQNPRDVLEVTGNLSIGNKLTFGGLAGEPYGNTLFIERSYNENQDQNELIIFKGNSGAEDVNGPARIRHIAAQHVFQTYTSTGESFQEILNSKGALGSLGDVPLLITDVGAPGRAVIGGQRSDAENVGTNTRLVVNGDIEFGGGGGFKLTGIQFATTTGVVEKNDIRNLLDSGTRRPLAFLHEIDESTFDEIARFDNDNRFGWGTQTPKSNLHIYVNNTKYINDVIRLESPNPGPDALDNKQTGLLLYTDDHEGGYVRGFSNAEYGTTGLVMGVSNLQQSSNTDCIHLIQTSNVGIGIAQPATKLHIYDGVPRIESSSSNAIIEFKTIGGTANIHTDLTGNLYLTPMYSATHEPRIILDSNVEVVGNFNVDGALDLGNQVAIGLAGQPAGTSLHVNGGVITNSDAVACKKYSHTFSVGENVAKDIQLIFGPGAFYAKVIAMLRRTDGSVTKDINTMVLEVQGGSGDGVTESDLDVDVGPVTIFGNTSYPWSTDVDTGTRGISIVPYNTLGTRIYSYDIHVELITACSGKLVKITRDLGGDLTKLDSPGNGGDVNIKTDFNY